MARSRHVRFTPDSGHSSVQVGCPKVPTADIVKAGTQHQLEPKSIVCFKSFHLHLRSCKMTVLDGIERKLRLARR